MNILIIGANGWIGSQFQKILNKCPDIKYSISKSRADNYDDLEIEINDINPTHLISFIGRTHGNINGKEYSTIDYLEEKGKLKDNIMDNLYAPLIILELCKKYNIHYTYLGTGCIFEYDKDHIRCQENLQEDNVKGFLENDQANFFGSSYSIVKGFTDKWMNMNKDYVLNLRIRMPITDTYNKRNFITKITTYEKICSIANSMSVLPELLPLVLNMMKNKTKGTLNLTNPGVISHNEILEMYKEIVDPTFKWTNFEIEEQSKILKSDRSNNYLNTDKLKELYPNVKNIKDAVRDCLFEYKNSLDEKYNLLITGGCGFIGSNFINHYFNNSKVNFLVNLDAMYYCADENNINIEIRQSNKYKFIKCNLCDSSLLTHILSEYKITHIINFAAQSHVQNSFEDSIKFTNDNIVGTHTLLECSRVYNKLSKFIHVSTDEVYGESMLKLNEQKKTEHSILCPTNPYAATKAAAELIAQSYHHSYKMPIIITRGNNVYGPNQYPEKIIPLFIKLLLEDKQVTIQGDGSSVRAFIHVEDTVRAFQVILEKGTIGEIYNIGCDNNMEYSILEVAKILIKLIKNTEDYDKWILYIEDRLFNDKRYYIENLKLKSLGWSINVKFLEGIKQLIAHYEVKYSISYVVNN
jgi:dTDP-glucose 4,6-dehydratase